MGIELGYRPGSLTKSDGEDHDALNVGKEIPQVLCSRHKKYSEEIHDIIIRHGDQLETSGLITT